MRWFDALPTPIRKLIAEAPCEIVSADVRQIAGSLGMNESLSRSRDERLAEALRKAIPDLARRW